ncbi:MAG: dihydroorotate dehydrogenase (quinone) [Acidocella sp. 20-63-7]|nr:MAG: dihydroorotate dehydrogenase (quinone) [Acidocella sp. 20-63-7]HQT45646.1 quinone-dependent dihydroorotate dehydrogenase [Acidocella sp.]
MTLLFATTRALMPLVRLLDPETAHNLSLRALNLGLAGGDDTPDDPILQVRAFGRTLPNPIGLAAGFDKNAVAVSALGRLGFGFVETGTVTPRPQPGNPKPRLFRLEADNAVINRMGFNNNGIAAYLANLQKADRSRIAVGANVGINKEDADPERDYPALVNAVSPLADYIVINISSPNTPGLRDLQSESRLAAILGAIKTDKPLFVKIAPDLSEDGLEAVIATCLTHPVTGLIVSNTTLARPSTLTSPAKSQTGGLSGAPLFAPSTVMLARAYKLAGQRLTLVGAGGVFSAEDALAKILAGASLVQLYTAFAYRGPALIPELKTGLAAALRARGFASVAQAVGAGA